MTIRTTATRAALLLVATASFTILSACTSGPRENPADKSTPAPVDGKDSKHHPGLMQTSGPRQGG